MRDRRLVVPLVKKPVARLPYKRFKRDPICRPNGQGQGLPPNTTLLQPVLTIKQPVCITQSVVLPLTKLRLAVTINCRPLNLNEHFMSLDVLRDIGNVRTAKLCIETALFPWKQW